MLDHKFVRDNFDLVKKAVADKNESVNLDSFLLQEGRFLSFREMHSIMMDLMISIFYRKIPQRKTSLSGREGKPDLWKDLASGWR